AVLLTAVPLECGFVQFAWQHLDAGADQAALPRPLLLADFLVEPDVQAAHDLAPAKQRQPRERTGAEAPLAFLDVGGHADALAVEVLDLEPGLDQRLLELMSPVPLRAADLTVTGLPQRFDVLPGRAVPTLPDEPPVLPRQEEHLGLGVDTAVRLRPEVQVQGVFAEPESILAREGLEVVVPAHTRDRGRIPVGGRVPDPVVRQEPGEFHN